MRECTMGDKRIAILMAVYNPRRDWLIEQLKSLNSQTYGNIMLYICDDCSPNVPFEKIEKCVRENITAFPYEITRNETNLGSNLTFQRLTEKAQGDYLAYCDQDDIWLPEKLEVLKNTLEQNGAELVCSDMYIIDGNGKQVADSITKVRRNHVFRSGEGLADTLWYSNFVSGCALLVKAQTAKDAVPFNPYMYYDHYIALFSANKGSIVSVPKPLIQHREHGGNQSSTLQGVTDKNSYIRLRVDKPASAVEWLSDNFVCEEKIKNVLATGLDWLKARQMYLHGNKKCAKVIWKYRKLSPMASVFEIAVPFMPKPVFKFAIWACRKIYS